jgi:tetratricopeptide (TPR) repeat protein
MPFRMYKSVKLGKGVRLNLSKTGVGLSAGVKGARYSVHSSGRRTTSVGVPGSGVSYRKTTSSKSRSTSARQRAPEPIAPVLPKAGLLAPKEEKIFVQGVTAYMQGRYEDALGSFMDVSVRDVGGGHAAEEFFAGLTLVALEQLDRAVYYFEAVLASDHTIPDGLMTKYGVGGDIEVAVTPATTVRVPMSNLSVALMLAEAYQRIGKDQKAIELLESLGAIAPGQPAFALSLADLYLDAGKWDEVVRVTEGITANEDDVSANILGFRAYAMVELGMSDAALVITKEALRSKKRSPELLWFARYVRGRAYEKAGKAGMARKEYETVYGENAHYGDVAARLGRVQGESELPPPPG